MVEKSAKPEKDDYKTKAYEYQDLPSMKFSAIAIILTMLGLEILFVMVIAVLISLVAWILN